MLDQIKLFDVNKKKKDVDQKAMADISYLIKYQKIQILYFVLE